MKILVTGAAGFIGYHTSRRLLERGDEVVGVDDLNAYYDVELKLARLKQLEPYSDFTFLKRSIADREAIAEVFSDFCPKRVIHLAAQPGVRYSIINPQAYVDSNLVGFGNILEGCRHNKVEHLVYASSSSVYGGNTQMPFSVNHPVDHPLSLYAATKKANELMAHTYSHLYKLPSTGLRFFTVYGPWGRPDMACFSFTKAIAEGRPIDVYNHGKMLRDFTYIDDIVEGVIRTSDRVPEASPGWGAAYCGRGAEKAPYRLYNIGNHHPVELMRFIQLLEQNLGKSARKNYLPMQKGDVPATYADISDLKRDVGFEPSTPIEVGVARFVEWYKDFYEMRDLESDEAGPGVMPVSRFKKRIRRGAPADA